MSAKDLLFPIHDEVHQSNKKIVPILRGIVVSILLLPPIIYSFYATKFIYVIISIIIDVCVITVLYCGIIHFLNKKNIEH